MSAGQWIGVIVLLVMGMVMASVWRHRHEDSVTLAPNGSAPQVDDNGRQRLPGADRS